MVVLSEDAGGDAQEKLPPPAHAQALASVQARLRHADRRPRARSARRPPRRPASRSSPRGCTRPSAPRRCCVRCACGSWAASCPTSRDDRRRRAGRRARPRASSPRGCATRTPIAALAADRAAARDPRRPRHEPLDHKLGGPSEERRYTCPSYVAYAGERARTPRPGYQPIEAYEVLLANVGPRPRAPRGSRPAPREVLAWAGTPLATVEVAALLGTDADGAREALAEAGAVERPVGRRRLLVAVAQRALEARDVVHDGVGPLQLRRRARPRRDRDDARAVGPRARDVARRVADDDGVLGRVRLPARRPRGSARSRGGPCGPRCRSRSRPARWGTSGRCPARLSFSRAIGSRLPVTRLSRTSARSCEAAEQARHPRRDRRREVVAGSGARTPRRPRGAGRAGPRRSAAAV